MPQTVIPPAPPSPTTREAEPAAGRSAPEAPPRPPRRGGPVERFLRVPLFWKLTVANAVVAIVIYFLGLFVGVRIAPRVGTASLVGIAGGSMALAAVGAVLLNALLVRLALSPLRRLEDAARRVQAGELDVRVGDSPLADEELAALMEGFDDMLDTLARARERQRRMASRVLESEERTRKWIARQLYDDIGQRIASMLIRVPTAWRSDDEGGPDAVLERIRVELVEALERIRASARRLRPPELDDLGLTAAVRAEARTFEEESGIPVELDAPTEMSGPDRSAALAFFRVIQEALSIAGRAGSGGPIRVALARENGHIHGEVRQEGASFSEALTRPREGLLGLEELRERAGYVEGRVGVRTDRGDSTLTVRIPGSPPPATGSAGAKADGRAGPDP